MIRLDYQPWGESLAELADAARRAEDAGAGVVWAPELHRSAPIAAAALISGTTTVGVGTGVALAFARSPMVTALTALDLDELSGGRFRLGLGSGVRKLIGDWHGVPFDPPVARLRDTVAAIRAVIAGAHLGDPIVHSGETSIAVRGWRRPHAPVRERIPIHLAAVGPAMTALAGEIGDGWLSHELCPADHLAETVLPMLRRGSARTGNRPEVVVSACCSVDADAGLARDRARGVVGFYASVKSYAELFAGAGFAAEHEATVAALRNGAAADALRDGVPPEMAAAFTLSGTRDDAAAGIARYRGLADAIKLSPPTHGLAPAEIRAAQDAVIDLIRELA
ncbi:alkanesulfonate monooxygenase SsuD/methylene tetrahydromethanopterin reductase-like flavin-dependent oxidoreductase (luciferase family) [Allocatelliglobosispora scoriae]|uniref:Alkanesulfonate monooxygenase SsuD/methylene tetrahydromethanopterin reductase-like flavin-dependent oxidoreductase (Luciferase family) n=1 Tax=Allocatelliglobosispora scoriae TaxID=643052 RepID=A0A841C0A2_9ACTN|nr:LLM class flavin-dependent oxidoreductase [Allocatelliglobosispora scoriae]MBB5873365.1 alkanesulfonate monooxygenase SsuD/methylene tetrahydromethanopterin reductase-like flavin-dependent oxidoreductase (luciferase family) [Allocatelliglobosispora scoriae]